MLQPLIPKLQPTQPKSPAKALGKPLAGNPGLKKAQAAVHFPPEKKESKKPPAPTRAAAPAATAASLLQGGGADGAFGAGVTALDQMALPRLTAMLEAFGEYPSRYRLAIW